MQSKTKKLKQLFLMTIFKTIIHPVRFTYGQLKWAYTGEVLNTRDWRG